MLLAGVVVAAMGWMLLAEWAKGTAPVTVEAASDERETAAVVLGGTGGGEVREPKERRVAVAWERKAGPSRKDARSERGGRVEPVLERTRTRPEQRVEKRPEKRPARPVEAVKRKKRSTPAKPFKARRPVKPEVLRKDAAEGPEGGLLSGFVGRECERQAPGAGLFCALVVDRVFSGGQAHGGR
ncbi:hypothetical protein ABGB12_21480 [Actinocorallia sp. B10E7]|uniref:hypothetical protein n=1 Tax=Actinocorallia sp. B10E7 TaxID=3153558 RepID=UPI00325CB2E6